MNDLLEVGPPERGPGLLIRPSSRTAIKDELMLMDSWFTPHAGGLAVNHRPQLILTRRVGVGLDSAEVGYPPSKFARVFERARAEGLNCVAHAGEEGPPSYVWEALDVLGVQRIDHGIRCLEDDQLVQRLVQDQVPLTVCPLSNVSLKVVDSIASHPLPTMMKRGLKVTVNSDDPAYFGGYIDDNFDALVEAGHVAPVDLATLARNSIEASFATPSRKRQLIGELEVALVDHPIVAEYQRPPSSQS